MLKEVVKIDLDGPCPHCGNTAGAVCPHCVDEEDGRRNLIELLERAILKAPNQKAA